MNWLTVYYDCNILSYTSADILTYWNTLTTPIDDQSEECIEYIYNLIT